MKYVYSTININLDPPGGGDMHLIHIIAIITKNGIGGKNVQIHITIFVNRMCKMSQGV